MEVPKVYDLAYSPQITGKKLNTDTLLLDIPNGQHSINSMYKFPQTSAMLQHLAVLMQDRPPPQETINNVYKLPSIKPAIRYLHGPAGFPTKRTWFEAIWKENYLSWPLVNVKNVNKFFPESEETQKGHMRGQRQGVRSTKPPSVYAVAGTRGGLVERTP